jgi:hypothetical protein
MKKPYYVTFMVSGDHSTVLPRKDMSASVDIEVGKFHGAKIIMKNIDSEVRAYLLSEYGINLINLKFTGVFKL